jgi:hypothetical protein
MSALPPKADMCSALAYVRFGPIADMTLLGYWLEALPRGLLQTPSPLISFRDYCPNAFTLDALPKAETRTRLNGGCQ